MTVVVVVAFIVIYPRGNVPPEIIEKEVSEVEPNNDALSSQKIHSGQTVFGNASDLNDPFDYFRVQVEMGSQLCANLSGPANTDFDLDAYVSPIPGADVVAISNQADTSKEQICLEAKISGFYYIAVFAYEGVGNYTLEIDVRSRISSVDGNDAIQEAVTAQSGQTIQSTLDKYWDKEDFYKIQAGTKQYLIAELDVPDNADFDLYIYNSTGTGGNDWHNFGKVYNEGASNRVWGDEFLNLFVVWAGYWYINIYAYRGFGAYNLTVLVEDSLPADDSDQENISLAEDVTARVLDDGTERIPGTLDLFNDADDYYKLSLDVGYTLGMKLEVPPYADFDMYVYNSTGTGHSDYILVSNTTSPEEILYLDILQTGVYYVNPSFYSGCGVYNLTLVLTGASGSPFANAGPDKPNERVNQPVSFDGGRSVDDVGIVSYEWDFGDGNQGTGETTSHSYMLAGEYLVTLTVRDGDGHASTDALAVNVLPTGGHKYAVVVGVSDYIHDEDVNDLTYADDDAVDWKNYLEGAGYYVTMLLNHDATLNNIVSAIEDMKAMEVAGDYVVFTFSGHGGPWTMARIKDPGYHTTVFAADANYLGDGALKDTDLGDLFSDFDSGHVFIFIDACYSGGMDEPQGTGRMIVQASSDSEYSWDAPRYQNGLWTYWFLEWGIQGMGYGDVETTFQNAMPKAVADTENKTHPEMEDGNPSDPFRL